MAETGSREGVEMEGNFSLEEVNEMTIVMKKLMRVRDVILRVNRQYIQSAAQSDEYRTEPPFKLQGSYRNMNRIAEKVVSIMNDEELDGLILSNYENDAQTLTSDTEANLLKLKELMDLMSPEESARWESIKRTFTQNVKLMGVEADDKIGQVVMQMGSFTDGLHSIRDAMMQGVQQFAEQPNEDSSAGEVIARLGEIKTGLETISRNITSTAEQIAKAAPAAEASPPAAASIDGQKAADAMIALADELRALTVGAVPIDPANPVHRVSVMHKVPRSILEVMESQFNIMQNWLDPLMNASRGQSEEIQALRQSLEACITNYDLLLKDPTERQVTPRRTRFAVTRLYSRRTDSVCSNERNSRAKRLSADRGCPPAGSLPPPLVTHDTFLSPKVMEKRCGLTPGSLPKRSGKPYRSCSFSNWATERTC